MIGNFILHWKELTIEYVLQAYKSCPRWLKEVYKNEETTYKERRLFTQGEIFQSTLHAVSSRLGFMHPLTPSKNCCYWHYY